MYAAIAKHRARIAESCRRHGVGRLDVVGSAARPDFNPSRSDVDFVVEFLPTTQGPGLNDYLGLKDDLERLIGTPVDLIMADAVANPFVQAALARDRTPLYAA